MRLVKNLKTFGPLHYLCRRRSRLGRRLDDRGPLMDGTRHSQEPTPLSTVVWTVNKNLGLGRATFDVTIQ